MQTLFVAVGAIALGSVLFANAAAAERGVGAASPEGAEQCAVVAASARMEAYGYSHVVTLSNHCEKSVTCEVWTNVDPTPHQTLSAEPGKAAQVVTRRGSPSRDVHAEKSCHFD
jgi:hypothetical protein